MSMIEQDRPLSCGLRDAAFNALKERKISQTFNVIADETGLEIGWLKRFSQGHISDPSASRVQTLFEYLKGRKLDVE